MGVLIPINWYNLLYQDPKFVLPRYVLGSRLHNAGSIGLPKWEPRSNICVYLGNSLFHSRSVALVYNPPTWHVSPQYHGVFDDDFAMVPYMEAGKIIPHWSDLVHSSSELAIKQALDWAQAWLGSTSQDNTDLQFTDNPVVDPFAIVTFFAADSTMRDILDHQNWNQDLTCVYILDTLCFTPEVLHLSTTHPLDMSAHRSMLYLMMTLQRYHI